MLLGNWGSFFFLRIPSLGNTEWCGAEKQSWFTTDKPKDLASNSTLLWENKTRQCVLLAKADDFLLTGYRKFTLEGAQRATFRAWTLLPSPVPPVHAPASSGSVQSGFLSIKDKYLQLLLLEHYPESSTGTKFTLLLQPRQMQHLPLPKPCQCVFPMLETPPPPTPSPPETPTWTTGFCG